MTSQRPLELDRIRHVEGELIRSVDLGDHVTGDRELLWWHQRAVHEAGTVAGLTIAWAEGDDSVVVAPGLAYDGRGHELWLGERTEVALPDDLVPSALLVRATSEDRDAELVWRPLARLGSCEGVPIALLGADGTVRPSTPRVRALERPHVAAGETAPEATPWEPWGEDETGRLSLGIETWVDTSAAGFTDLPCYFAWLNWPQPGAERRVDLSYGSLGLQYVQNESVRGFTFHVHLVARRRAGDPAVSFARRERLSVCWVGVECDHDPRGTRRRRNVAVR